MKKRQVVAIHGGDSFNTYGEYLRDLEKTVFDLAKMKTRRGWKANLQDALGSRFDVIIPRMPNASNARYREWKIVFKRLLKVLDNDLILIGHSLGAIFLVKYLSEEKMSKTVKALFLVATPYNTKTYHPLADFNLSKPVNNLLKKVKIVHFYQSKDDKSVPVHNFKRYQKDLPVARFTLMPARGHFNQEKFPELVRQVKKLKT